MGRGREEKGGKKEGERRKKVWLINGSGCRANGRDPNKTCRERERARARASERGGWRRG